MPALSTSIDPTSREFLANAAAMRALVEELQKRRMEAAAGGPEKARERHLSRGKLLPRERVMRLVDPGAPFLELSPARRERHVRRRHPWRRAHHRHRPRRGPRMRDRGNDSTIKGGTYYPLTVKKHLRAQEIAAREPSALHLSRRLRRRQPAAPDRGLPRPRALRPHLLQPGAAVGGRHRADRRGHGLVHGGRRLRAGHVRRDHHRARAGHDLSRPARRW